MPRARISPGRRLCRRLWVSRAGCSSRSTAARVAAAGGEARTMSWGTGARRRRGTCARPRVRSCSRRISCLARAAAMVTYTCVCGGGADATAHLCTRTGGFGKGKKRDDELSARSCACGLGSAMDLGLPADSHKRAARAVLFASRDSHFAAACGLILWGALQCWDRLYWNGVECGTYVGLRAYRPCSKTLADSGFLHNHIYI